MRSFRSLLISFRGRSQEPHFSPRTDPDSSIRDFLSEIAARDPFGGQDRFGDLTAIVLWPARQRRVVFVIRPCCSYPAAVSVTISAVLRVYIVRMRSIVVPTLTPTRWDDFVAVGMPQRKSNVLTVDGRHGADQPTIMCALLAIYARPQQPVSVACCSASQAPRYRLFLYVLYLKTEGLDKYHRTRDLLARPACLPDTSLSPIHQAKPRKRTTLFSPITMDDFKKRRGQTRHSLHKTAPVFVDAGTTSVAFVDISRKSSGKAGVMRAGETTNACCAVRVVCFVSKTFSNN